MFYWKDSKRQKNITWKRIFPLNLLPIEDTGHEITQEILEDIIKFFKNNTGEELNEI